MRVYRPILDQSGAVLSVVPLDGRPNGVSHPRAKMGGTFSIGSGAWSSDDWAKLIVQTFRLLSAGEEMRDPFSQNPWIYAAARLKADSLASVPLQGWSGIAEDEAKDRRLPRNHPVQRLLSRPCPTMTAAEFVATYSLSMDLYGEFIAFFYDSAGALTTDPARVAYIVPQAPGSLTEIAANGYVPAIKAWLQKSRPGDQPVPFDASLHVKEPCPEMAPKRGCLRGHAPVTAALLGARSEWKIKRANESAIENGCSFGGMLIGREWDHNEVEAIRKEVKEKYAGVDRQDNLVIVGGSEATFVPNAISQEKMQYLGQLEWYRQEALSCLGVPATLVSLSENVNFATAIDAKRWFWAHTQVPRMEKLEQALEIQLLSRMDGPVYARFDRDAVAAILEDWKAKLEWSKGLKELGPYDADTINRRLNLGMPGSEWTKKAWMNGAMRTAESLMKMGEMEETPKVEKEQERPQAGTEKPPENADTMRPERETERSQAERECAKSLANFFNAQRRAFGYRVGDLARGKIIEEKSWPWETEKWNEGLCRILEPSWIAFAKEALGEEAESELGELTTASALDERRRCVEEIERGYRARVVEALAECADAASYRSAVNALFNRDRDLRCEIIAREERAAVHESILGVQTP